MSARGNSGGRSLLNVSGREDGRSRVRSLVERFRERYDEYTVSGSRYNETQTRNDFINPFLRALGWDVFNQGNVAQHLREVVLEDTVEVGEESRTAQKKPDYALRMGGKPKFFLEAKKPSVPIGTAKQWAFQIRRYGWSAKLPISVLMNFDQLIIYDCLPRPKAGDDVRVARIERYDYTEYETKFDEIYDLLSREAVYSGGFDETFTLAQARFGTEPFDQYFLEQMLEPNEAEKLPLPLIGADKLNLAKLNGLLLREGIEAVLDVTDEILLVNGLGLSAADASRLRSIWRKLRDRRINRKYKRRSRA